MKLRAVAFVLSEIPEPVEIHSIDEPAGPTLYEMVLQFGQRRERIPEEACQFWRLEAIETLTNVATDRRRRFLEALAEFAMLRHVWDRTNSTHLRPEIVCKLPTLEICEMSRSHTLRNGIFHAANSDAPPPASQSHASTSPVSP